MRIDGGYYAYGSEPPQPTRPVFSEVKLLSTWPKGFDGCDGDHTCDRIRFCLQLHLSRTDAATGYRDEEQRIGGTAARVCEQRRTHRADRRAAPQPRALRTDPGPGEERLHRRRGR